MRGWEISGKALRAARQGWVRDGLMWSHWGGEYIPHSPLISVMEEEGLWGAQNCDLVFAAPLSIFVMSPLWIGLKTELNADDFGVRFEGFSV